MKIAFVIFLLSVQYLIAQTDRMSELADSLLTSDTLIADTAVNSDTVRVFKLSVTSNLKDAKIYADTTFIGLTPLTDHELKEGSYDMKIINPKSLQDWQNNNAAFNIYLGNDTTINVDFQYYYYINSDPYDAAVFKNDSNLGDTPLRFFNDHELTGNLLIKKKNYKDYLFNLSNYNFETGANILLQSKGKEKINDLVYKDRGTQFNTRRTILPILGTAGAALAGCAMAFTFKDDANQYYDRYLVFQNPADLENSNKSDTKFLISVLLMQVAIGGLIYFLFFDK